MKTQTRKEYKTCVTPSGDWVFREKGSRRVLANFGGDYALCKYYAQRFCHGSNAHLAHGHEDGKSICFFETFHAGDRRLPLPHLDREYYKIHSSIPTPEKDAIEVFKKELQKQREQLRSSWELSKPKLTQ